MLRRVEEVARVDTRQIWGGTFHHVAHRVLREHAPVLGYAKGYSILDREDTRDVMSAAVAECGLAVGARRFPKADVLVDLVSMAVNTQTPLVGRGGRPAAPVPPAHRRDPAGGAPLRRAQARAQRDGLRRPPPQLEAAAGRARAGAEAPGRAIPARARRRVPGHEQAAGRRRRSRRQRAPQPVRGGRRRAVHLRLPRRALREHPRLRAALPRRAALRPHRQLPLDAADPRAGQRLHRLQREAVREGAHQRARRRRAARRWSPAATSSSRPQFVAQRVLELRDEGIPLPEIAVLYRAHHHAMEIQFELARRGIPFVVRSGRALLRGRAHQGRAGAPALRAQPGRRAGAEARAAARPGHRHAPARMRSGTRSRRGGAAGPGGVDELLAPDVAGQVAAQGARRLPPAGAAAAQAGAPAHRRPAGRGDRARAGRRATRST